MSFDFRNIWSFCLHHGFLIEFFSIVFVNKVLSITILNFEFSFSFKKNY